MKQIFIRLALIVALAFAVPFTACNNDKEIDRIDNNDKELLAKITILETFKTWAEAQPGGFQSQIDDLEDALREANALIAGADSAVELTRRLDELIAGSTLTIADIQSKLEDHDQEIEDLWDALELIDGGGDISTLLQRIAALEQADEDIWDAINSISIGGGDGFTLAELEALIEELIAEALAGSISNIVFIPEYDDGAATDFLVVSSDPLKVEPTVVISPLEMNFLISPASGAALLAADPGALSGVVNEVLTTRAITGEIPVTAATAEGGVLTVTFDVPQEFIPANLSSSGLQIALKAALAEVTLLTY